MASVQYAVQGAAFSYLTFGMAVAGGVIAGSFVHAVVTRGFRIEWFHSWSDFFNHVIGGLVMGIGGVLAMGCTIGQGISGNSTLAVGSALATVSIVLGAALTMKYQYYRMLHDEASRAAAMLTALADLKLIPDRLRKLEAL